MSAKFYTIRSNGYVISRKEDFFHVSTANCDAIVNLQDGKYRCGGVNISDGNAWIDDTLVVRSGGALCYSISYAGYTITRSAGSPNIVIKGRGILEPFATDNTMLIFDENSVVLSNGIVFVGNEQLVHNGTLFAHGVDSTEAEVRLIEQASQPTVAPTSRSTAQSHPGLRLVDDP
jgi:hypothetical protein